MFSQNCLHSQHRAACPTPGWGAPHPRTTRGPRGVLRDRAPRGDRAHSLVVGRAAGAQKVAAGLLQVPVAQLQHFVALASRPQTQPEELLHLRGRGCGHGTRGAEAHWEGAESRRREGGEGQGR